ncbi:tRNA (N6-threonylcarbamoyladenosine(37)-N6)-methyltransferase TrmO [Reinekea marinisedimentorum]|uniref:tRNA-Thr(GGU) m(6)t(6)A37 methyltransferase TsaA n=1 Tax=Reinekea marinisedimentorum TaxID=230495 RepID=A0A4V2UK87_9GAMM|nr:tRNA (N6-threonylcarbamoyladenosine(37)-N6)-methyltransferase TrmO [Reinekea marinisedimentorum]TCS43292.1 tRNA-Thr(GGU) m(6)t(6)A37 methyltransferase TsaA [Reinekea marinisedimentorum]
MQAIEPIGIIETPFQSIEDMPIQPKGAAQVTGCIVVHPQYATGLKDLEGFSHLYLIYRFHAAKRTELEVVPFMDTQTRGVFATRSPARPNHIGLSVVELARVEGNRVYLNGIDVLNGTPVLDIKPYIEKFDRVEQARSGWMTGSSEDVANRRSDARFG